MGPRYAFLPPLSGPDRELKGAVANTILDQVEDIDVVTISHREYRGKV
jgi:hypothetical protein